ncbi:2-furoyl-CoA dehydrogenase large subunit [Tistlia consotensis]|uniref:Xanthine dehydrogenase, molybdenum binding subunit apoprotein n=1 Tax=Tistlia consotensis USBA 355 TaxID=560819 RepID=A0A1Y6CPC3_9PROT|nr:molybdopterin cofactor-binding domain-containing protein [Tistlia consotensis]SMF80101.1 xanthine dehydrogenase, molybdenum binding subunit apoprotein [Tistlia consotensis USBA 355]SNR62173.1 2-furoyl-CoA dehydrogenase large subunit [Tistlia consotensis]
MSAAEPAPSQTSAKPGHLGRSLPRFEDAALLTGRGRFLDDLPVGPATLQAAILRSPHAHARIVKLDVSAARALPGVAAVLTSAEVQALSAPLVVGVKAPMTCWPIATDRVRYVGEPVAVVVAADRYLAEDALEAIAIDYAPLPAVVDPERALAAEAPVLHEGLGGNLASDRSFRYGDPEAAFETAAHRIGITVRYPRNAVTPIETYGMVCEWDPGEDGYEVTANFQGPFSIHAVIARSLKVPGNRLRLKTPRDSGGSFGVKQGMFPVIVLMALAARLAGRPVKWIEDRLEHLTASVSATNRVVTLAAAVEADGKITALDWDQLEDVGAHLRAPEPATLYRMHGNLTGAYDIRNLAVRNRVVVTNKTPTGLNRGFGGPQVYFALERLVQKIAVTLGLDPVAVIRRNLIPAGAFPYRTASGGLYDSGDYQKALETALRDGGHAALVEKRDRVRAAGGLYGIGFATVVEPSVSNMGYVSTVMTAAERAKAGPKNGAQATATVALDPVGGVSVHVASVPQGQGHRTVLAQTVADSLGLEPAQIRVVAELDTARDAWSIASGNYASRFAAAVAGTAHLAAEQLKAKLARLAAAQLNVPAEALVFEGGRVCAADTPDNAIPFARLAATAHWAPGTIPEAAGQALRETVYWTPPQLTAPTPDDQVNSSLCHGFILDICGVAVERASGRVVIDRYVTMHDCGRVLHPGMVEGQIVGGFANAVGAALYEEYAYGPDGAFLAGSFADYLVPTVAEVPRPEILHVETPSPFTPLGAKGVGEGNCMSTPVAIANAVADALGVEDVILPLTPARVRALLDEPEPPAPAGTAPAAPPKRAGGRALAGTGSAGFAAPPQRIWDTLLDPATLEAIVPGCHKVEKLSETRFLAEVTLGVGPVKGRYSVEVALSDLVEPASVTLTASASGALGTGAGQGHVRLAATPEGGTRLDYDYEADVGGKVAAVGGRLLDGAARLVIGQFFAALGRQAGGGTKGGGATDGGATDGAGAAGPWTGLLGRLLRLLGIGS